MCRTDFQSIDGYFDSGLAMDYPITPGHEIAGWVDGVGAEARVGEAGGRRSGRRLRQLG